MTEIKSATADPVDQNTNQPNWVARATRTLDTLSPAFVPFATWWDRESDRRKSLRTPENLKALLKAQAANTSARATAATARNQRKAAAKASRNPLNGARRAARTADKAASGHARKARADLKTAKVNYPQTLQRLAVKVHAAHAAPSALAAYALSTPDDWVTLPPLGSAVLIGAHAAGLWLGRRGVQGVSDDAATAEERALMERLAPAYWVEHAQERGLSGTVTTPPELTGRGVECEVRLDGEWTVKGLAGKVESIGTLLGARTDLTIRVQPTTRRGWARIVLRTRQAVTGDILYWTPESEGVGLDLETGEPVDIPIEGTHKGIAAATNMGKSTFWRPWMMRAVEDPLMTGVLLDPKRQEARVWRGKIRTEGHQMDSDIRQYIYDGICELEREMRYRQSIAEVTQWVPTPEHPILLVVIEEMANIIRMSKDKRWKDVLDKLDGLLSEARAAGIWFIWATQFPSRSGGGVTPQIAENTLTMVALTTEGGTSDAVIFGNDGPKKGWQPSELGGEPGRALIKHKKRSPSPVQGWYVTDETIKALPDAEPWRHEGVEPEGPRGLSLVKEDDSTTPVEVSQRPPAEEPDRRAAVLEFRRQNPSASLGAISKATSVPKATVSRWIKADEAESA